MPARFGAGAPIVLGISGFSTAPRNSVDPVDLPDQPRSRIRRPPLFFRPGPPGPSGAPDGFALRLCVGLALPALFPGPRFISATIPESLLWRRHLSHHFTVGFLRQNLRRRPP